MAIASAALMAERWFVFDVIAQFAAPTLSAAAIGGGVCLLLRCWRIAAAFGAAMALLVWAMAPQLWPPNPASAASIAPIRVYLANLYVSNPEPALAAESIARERPDVIALVEVGPRHERALWTALAAYPHRLSSVDGAFRGKRPRILIASRWPLRVDDNARRDGLAVTDATVGTPHGPIRMVVSHLTRPWPFDDPGAQMRQAERLRRRLAAGDLRRTLVMGDFNAVPAGAVLRRFARESGLRPLAALSGTWPAWAPPGFRVAIDNAFVGEGLSLSNRRIAAPTGSDHRAVVFSVRPTASSRAAPTRQTRPSPPNSPRHSATQPAT